jgi:hypothetical protein
MRTDDTLRLARQIAEINTVVPGIIASRLMRIAWAGTQPSRSDRNELTRMSSEKWQAASQSAVAATMFLFNLQMEATQSFWQAAMFPWLGTQARQDNTGSNPGAGLMTAALAPYHRIATANAKRLRKT